MSVNLNTIIWIVILVWLLSRQIRKRPIGRRSGSSGKSTRRLRLAPILIGLGLIQFLYYLDHNRHFSGFAITILLLSFIVCGLLSVIRAHTVHIWRESEGLMRQGTWITISLWLVGTALHLVAELIIDHNGGPAGAGSATMLIYLGFAVFIQTVFLKRRVRQIVTKERRAAYA
jgi:hypothetical protein